MYKFNVLFESRFGNYSYFTKAHNVKQAISNLSNKMINMNISPQDINIHINRIKRFQSTRKRGIRVCIRLDIDNF